VEDFAFATAELAGGATMQLSCSWKLPAGCDAVIEASFYGTEGGATLRNVNGSFMEFEGYRMRGTRREPLSAPDEPWFGQAAVDWTRRLSLGQKFDPAAQHLVQVARVLDSIYGQGELT
jgi:predicted dehydrogenase